MTTQIDTRVGVLTATLITLIAAISVMAVTAIADQGDTTRVSVDNLGNQGDNHSYFPSISATGRYVAFHSEATNLVANDTNDALDVFVHDRDTNTTTRVSVDDLGNQGNDDSTYPAISGDGRYITFHSDAANLVPGDSNDSTDVFVHDRDTNTTTRVSVHTNGNQGNWHSQWPSISADGRYVAFYSHATNLVPGDSNDSTDVFVHDRSTNTTTRVSVHTNGNQGNDGAGRPAVSANGQFVTYSSVATNLVPGDTNGERDVFVHDRNTNTTTRISVHTNGNQGDDDSHSPAVSANGLYVTFWSHATTLVSGDSNGESDVFVHERNTNTTTRVSVHTDGTQGDNDSWFPTISATGRYVTFHSRATNLVPGDANFRNHVLVHDRDTTITTRVSVDGNGAQGDHDSTYPTISADGRYVAFDSDASNLVANDTNGVSDVMVHQYLADPPPPTTSSTTSTSTSTTSTTTTTTMPPGASDFFTDDNGHLFEDDVNAIAEAGITRGCNPPANDRYCPDESFLRGQAAAFLRRALDVPASDTDHFTDDDSSVFEGDINAIATEGITLGCNPPDNTLFCPNDPFTRGQAAAFVRRALNVPANETDHFTDDNSSVFEEDINAIAEAGITRGCNPPDNDRYCPGELLTRGQAAAFMRRALLP